MAGTVLSYDLEPTRVDGALAGWGAPLSCRRRLLCCACCWLLPCCRSFCCLRCRGLPLLPQGGCQHRLPLLAAAAAAAAVGHHPPDRLERAAERGGRRGRLRLPPPSQRAPGRAMLAVLHRRGWGAQWEVVSRCAGNGRADARAECGRLVGTVSLETKSRGCGAHR